MKLNMMCGDSGDCVREVGFVCYDVGFLVSMMVKGWLCFDTFCEFVFEFGFGLLDFVKLEQRKEKKKKRRPSKTT